MKSEMDHRIIGNLASFGRDSPAKISFLKSVCMCATPKFIVPIAKIENR